MGQFRELCEELKIVKKNWKFIDNTGQGYTIEINDTEAHPILSRIKTRTNSNLVKLNDMNSKLQLGVDLILKKASKNNFRNTKKTLKVLPDDFVISFI